ncbi:EamA family transporter [Streptomyces sp. SID486]|uniref:EamA family transporter n=1 Tax=unclassified Streptomyces TaxID=2593676 RepID=UPI0013682F3F|nr:EamA family transporter [Streptomyces sp. SID161]MYX99283.1 EamA family transporter [Streptomyces sp. SID486]
MTSAQANQGTASPDTPAPSSGTPPLAVAAGVLTVFLWASAFIGIRAAGKDLDPGALTLARLFIGAVLLGAVVLVRKVPLPPRSDLPRLFLCGLLWFGIYNVALNAAEQRIDAGTTSMIISLGPVLIAVLAGFLLKEGFPRPLVVGGIVALAGVVLIGLATSSKGLDAGTGSALALLAAAAYAGGVVTEKPLLANSSALVITWLACVVGAVLCLPFLPQLIGNLSHASGEAIGWTLYLGVFPTSVAFTTWGYALARSTAGKMGALTYLSPPIAVTLAWLILDETPPWLAVVGGALSLAGVVYSQRKK